jgi:hypothetical protein
MMLGISVLLWLIPLGVPAVAQTAALTDTNEVFTVVLLPDTQFYCEKYPETFVSQTMWIRERARTDNFKFVIGLGDIVQNAQLEQEWQNAHEAARLLDSVIPYSTVPGNHDLVTKDKALTRNSELYNKYFGVDAAFWCSAWNMRRVTKCSNGPRRPATDSPRTM